jgi:hypothetical protein
LWQSEIWDEALGGERGLLCYLGPRVPTSKFSPAYLLDSDLFVRNTVALGYAESLATGRVGVPVGRLQGPLLVVYMLLSTSTAKYLLLLLLMMALLTGKFPWAN